MTYEIAANKWAAKRFNIDINTIKSVDIDHNKGYGGCDTCDYGGECEIEVTVWLTNGKYDSFDIDINYNFSDLLKELLEA